MIYKKKSTKKINIGGVLIGGGEPVAIQSMTKTRTSDVKATVKQILKLESIGCQIIRCAIPDEKSALAIKKIKNEIHIPLVADIHFDYRLAILAAEMGADKLRINPGNIGSSEKIKAIVFAAKDAGIPIRVGVNSGSLDKNTLNKFGQANAKALVESALSNVSILEKFGFHEIVVAVKSTSVKETIEAYRLLSQKTKYPLHLGVTESGTPAVGIVKSAIGIGALLSEGIGDTIRVSLTSNPEEEVKAAYQILQALELISQGVNIISCPTCGRCKIDIEKIAKEIYEKTRGITTPLTVAIMGCEVNGPGEARSADVGLAGGANCGLIFKNGKVVKKVAQKDAVKELIATIKGLKGGKR